MPTIRMRALQVLPDRHVLEGEEFDVARPIEALALSYSRKAQLLSGARLHLETRDLSAESPTNEPSTDEPVGSPDPSDDPPRRRRRYRRRDLTAEP